MNATSTDDAHGARQNQKHRTILWAVPQRDVPLLRDGPRQPSAIPLETTMKPFRSALLLCGALSIAGLPALAQERDTTLPRVSPNASAAFQLGVTQVEVRYGAPSVRQRVIFGDLVPYGEVWRTGANEATTVSFSTDVLVEEQPLAAGTYMLATIPAPDRWTIVFNRRAGQWGAFQHDPAQDALRVDVQPRSAPHRETMAFTFDNFASADGRDTVELVLHWADVAVPVRLVAETDRHVEARAAEALRSEDWRRPLAFARYALQSGRHLDQALAWADAAVRLNESYATLVVRARIQAAQGDYAGAVETAERALALAATMDEPPAGAAALREEVEQWLGRSGASRS